MFLLLESCRCKCSRNYKRNSNIVMINDEIDSRLGFETRAMMRWWIARSYKIGLLQEKCAIKNRFLPWIDFARVNYLNTRSSRRTLSRGNKMQSGNKSRSNCFQRLRSFLGRKKNNFTAVIPPQKAGRGQQLKRNFFYGRTVRQ